MAFNINRLRTDAGAESKGVWVEAGAGLRLKIARLGNPEYTKYLNQLLKPLRQQIQGVGEIDPKEVERVTLQAMSRHILLGWENLTDVKKNSEGTVVLGDDGKPQEEPVPYTPEKAMELLQIADFAEIVSGFARRAELFRIAERKDAEGN